MRFAHLLKAFKGQVRLIYGGDSPVCTQEQLSEIQRKSALWTYSMFFYGEDSVTDNLSPYIDAAPKEEQKYFLATQQVDEARHRLAGVDGIEQDALAAREQANRVDHRRRRQRRSVFGGRDARQRSRRSRSRCRSRTP
mgnify:CR=1 FL=1